MSSMLPASLGRDLAYSTVRIECAGPRGSNVGTGFGYVHHTDAGVIRFLVTNRHVVEGVASGRFFFTRAVGPSPTEGPRPGQRIDMHINAFRNGWTFHPDPAVDLAVFPFDQIHRQMVKDGNLAYFLPIGSSALLSTSEEQALDIVEEVVFVGYPTGLFDRQHLFPLFRHGITATPPALDYDGTRVVLIDASVHPGSSGSPVFLANAASLARASGRVRLLGVVGSVFLHRAKGRMDCVAPLTPTANVRDHVIDIGIVYKASLIEETVAAAIGLRKLRPVVPDVWVR